MAEFVSNLRRLADALESGKRFDIQIAGERIRVPARAVCSIEHEVEAGDVEALRALGWTDQEILEATHYGADMVRHGILFKAFHMDE